MALFGRKPEQPQVTIDLRESRPELKFGSPTPCPECSANGYLDSIDPGQKVMYQHCRVCFSRWETYEHELATEF